MTDSPRATAASGAGPEPAAPALADVPALGLVAAGAVPLGPGAVVDLAPALAGPALDAVMVHALAHSARATTALVQLPPNTAWTDADADADADPDADSKADAAPASTPSPGALRHVLVLGGVGTFSLGAHRHSLASGHLLLVPPGAPVTAVADGGRALRFLILATPGEEAIGPASDPPGDT